MDEQVGTCSVHMCFHGSPWFVLMESSQGSVNLDPRVALFPTATLSKTRVVGGRVSQRRCRNTHVGIRKSTPRVSGLSQHRHHLEMDSAHSFLSESGGYACACRACHVPQPVYRSSPPPSSVVCQILQVLFTSFSTFTIFPRPRLSLFHSSFEATVHNL